MIKYRLAAGASRIIHFFASAVIASDHLSPLVIQTAPAAAPDPAAHAAAPAALVAACVFPWELLLSSHHIV